MTIRAGDVVSVLRNISRKEDIHYAYMGDSGIVLEVFKAGTSAEYSRKTLYAKVKMDLPGNPIKTFRLTSLSREA